MTDQVCITRAAAETALACVEVLAADEREPERYRTEFAEVAAHLREVLANPTRQLGRAYDEAPP